MKTTNANSVGPAIAELEKSEEKQLRELRDYLATSEPFRECRGKFGGDWFNTDVLNDTRFDSPSSVEREFDRRHGKGRVLMNYLAKLKREGKTTAYGELLHALTRRDFVITGEELPLDRREKGVLVMVDSDRMLNLIRWFKLFVPQIIHRHIGHFDHPYDSLIQKGYLIDRPGMKSFTEKVLDENPSIREGLVQFHDSDHKDYYRAQMWMPESLFPADFKSKEWFVDEDGWESFFDKCMWLRCEKHERHADGYEQLGNWGVAAFFPEMTQADVLRMFRREKQPLISTWMFEHPTTLSLSGYSLSMGFFPEGEVGRFQKKWPSYTSLSLNKGMGAVLLDARRPIAMDDSIFEKETYRTMQEDPDPKSMGFRLHFPRFG